ncbi:hypothetical protein ACMD2_02009 [Ananas comosus]|uniref:Acid phosphatase 1-like n=1 Tax=Ananas comosus TaxID=4615 RepID=A0A199W588_ANACO|nr:hypothetical protein ACMD2_02009 [Ananas comosus]
MSTLGGRGRGTRESCVDEHVTGYYARRGGHYADANEALGFARTVRMGDDGMDAWIFDVDETLISNIGRLGCARFSFTSRRSNIQKNLPSPNQQKNLSEDKT